MSQCRREPFRRPGTPPAATPQPITNGATVTIPVNEDGHYWVDALVNGKPVHFLIDSGATVTALSQGTADSLNVLMDAAGGDVVMMTANGEITARRSMIGEMALGPIRAHDLPVVVSPAFGSENVLGMNFLGKLKSWRVQGGNMVLEAP